ncbi:unnamed protein product, partial [Staurois parvus]
MEATGNNSNSATKCMGSAHADAHRSRQLSAESIAKYLQTSCGLQISTTTVHRELHGIDFHG